MEPIKQARMAGAAADHALYTAVLRITMLRFAVLRFGMLVIAVLVIAAPPAAAQVQDEEPTGMYDLDSSCSLRAGMVRCLVGIDDLGTGEPLFETAIVTKLGSETTWSASPVYAGTPYLFRVTVLVDELGSEVELEVFRDGQPAGRQRMRSAVATSG